MRPRLVVPAILLLAAGGCHFGPRAKTFPPAQGPAGVQAKLLQLGGQRIEGELLEVQETGLLLVVEGEVARVPFSAIRRGTFRGRAELREGRPPSSSERDQLALVSRFPQGLGAELLEKLLATYGQSEVKDWSP